MRDLKGQWALVTGASSGFGIDFAHLLAERGANLVLVARRIAPMEALADALRAAHGTECRVIPMDLARAEAVRELVDRIAADGIAIDLLINNAGYGLFGRFTARPVEQTLNMLQLNIHTMTELTHRIATGMVERGHGQILLIASVGGYQASPLYAAYSASKSYVLLFGEALNEELRDRGVTVTVLSPGISETGFLATAGQRPSLYQRVMMMQSRPVARIGLEAMRRGRASIVAGYGNSLLAWMNRLVPRFIQRKVAHRMMIG